jgi:hypothetical protein
MCLFHVEVVELVFGVCDRVVWSKGCLEIRYKVQPAVHPEWTVCWISGV